MSGRSWKGNWAQTLNLAQRQAVMALRQERNACRVNVGSDGWMVYMTPSIGPARYLEARHYLTEGTVARWVIERDGRTSAWNEMGRLRRLVEAPDGETAPQWSKDAA